MNKNQTLKTIGEILTPDLLNFAKCENCNVRYKERDKKWCKWCIERFTRTRSSTPEKMASIIQKSVEPIYLDAEVADFLPPVKNHLENWNGIDNLFFVGDTGTGKTRAMYAILKVAIANGFYGTVIDFGRLCRNIRSAFDTKIPEQQLRDKYLNLDVLLIDDMGLKESFSDYEYDVFYDILDGRICNQLSTVISSNKTPEQVSGSFDCRIASRLMLFKTVEFTGSDRRKGELK